MAEFRAVRWRYRFAGSRDGFLDQVGFAMARKADEKKSARKADKKRLPGRHAHEKMTNRANHVKVCPQMPCLPLFVRGLRRCPTIDLPAPKSLCPTP